MSEPRAEDMFLDWFLRLPAEANLAVAARLELERLDGAGEKPAIVERLRELFRQAALARPVAARRRRAGKAVISLH